MRSVYIIDGSLSEIWHWLSSNTLVFLEGIKTLQKSYFLNTFLCNSSLVFVLSEWRQYRQWKSESWVDVTLFNNGDSLFIVR